MGLVGLDILNVIQNAVFFYRIPNYIDFVPNMEGFILLIYDHALGMNPLKMGTKPAE